MASVQAFDAFHAYLEGEWTGAAIQWENDASAPPDTPETLVFAEIYGGLYQQESVGAPGGNLWRESGMLYLHVMSVRGTGSREARVIATNLSNLFRERGPAGIRIIDMSIGAGEPGENDGNFFRTTLQVGFERDSY